MTWPKLSGQLTGPRSPAVCQSCGGDAELARWREHDEGDRPTSVMVVLCKKCANRLIEKHPRLYAELYPNDPHPGCMAICLDCRHRDGTRCAHPDAKANGGTGVMLSIATPHKVHLCRSPRRLSGWTTIWRSPASACRQKEPIAQEARP